MTNDRGEYGNVKLLRGGSLFSRAPYGGSPAPNDGGWAYRGGRAFHGHEAPTYGRGGLWSSKREAPLGRGGLAVGEDTRGQYGMSRRLGMPRVGYGYEISDAARHSAEAASNLAMEPLMQARGEMMKAWKPAMALTSDQMTKIQHETVALAREVEKNIVDMIHKAPPNMEELMSGALLGLRKSLADAPKFEALVASWGLPMPVPGFRGWINHLLAQVEDGVGAIARVADIVPHWLFLVDIVTKMYHATIGLLHGVVTVVTALWHGAEGAAKMAEGLPTALKVAGIAVLAVGAVWVVSKVVKSTTHVTPPSGFYGSR